MYKLTDKKIIFSLSEEFKYLPLINFTGKSDVYKIRVNNEMCALKIFTAPYEGTIEDYEAKLDINIDSYITPIRLSYLNGRFNGYLMKFCDGKDLSLRKLNIPVTEFAESSIKLIDDTEKLSKAKYRIYDVFRSNVMYDGGFKMIDTDDYKKFVNMSEEDLIKENNSMIRKILVTIFFNSTGLANKFYDNDKLNELMNYCLNGKITFDELFNIVCTMAYNTADLEIKRLSDIGKALKKTKE